MTETNSPHENPNNNSNLFVAHWVTFKEQMPEIGQIIVRHSKGREVEYIVQRFHPHISFEYNEMWYSLPPCV